MAVTLTHAIMFIALVDFFALKYRQANVKYKLINFKMIGYYLPQTSIYPH
jgi:hypothetical protein